MVKLLDALPSFTGLAAGLSLTHSTNADLQRFFVNWLRTKINSLIDEGKKFSIVIIPSIGDSLSENEREVKLTNFAKNLVEEIGVERSNFFLTNILQSTNPYCLPPKVVSYLQQGMP